MSTWEYRHVLVDACDVEVSGGFMGMGKETTTSPYPHTAIQDKLNQLGLEGWELVSMEPHWYWERVSISGAMQITHPFAISAWYCTFKRAK